MNSNSYRVVILVFVSGLLQGLTLVSFPALSSVLKTALNLSDTAYGAIFLPQVALTAAGAVAGGLLSKRLGLPTLLRLSLAANGLSQLALLASIAMAERSGFGLVVLGTSLLGLGFGLSAAPLNRYPVVFFPNRQDSALTALHTFIATGLAVGPLVVGLLVDTGLWTIFPAGLAALALTMVLLSLPLRFPADAADSSQQGESTGLTRSPTFWLLFAVAIVYALCEGLFSNWAVIFLQEDKQVGPKQAGFALSVFWAALAAGRLLTSWLVSRLPANGVWLSFPLLMAGALWLLPAVNSPGSGIATYGLAGLACSGFFPLTVGRAALRFPQHAALVSSLMVAALMLGVGLGSFALGSLRSLFPLSIIFRMAMVLPALAAGLGLLILLSQRRARSPDTAPSSCHLGADPSLLTAHDGVIVCPACGGVNPKDAVFCGNPECHKALGEFKYVLEELLASRSWIERLADRVTQFVSKPHFILLHLFWFVIWILANSGLVGYFQVFDEYPYSLLGIILAIEAILITGFLLISQNHQYAYSEKRAELDYEINIRSYRKLVELEQRLSLLNSQPGASPPNETQ